MMPAVLSVGEIAALVGGVLEGPGDVEIAGVSSLGEADGGDLSFVASRSFLPQAGETRAAALLVSQAIAGSAVKFDGPRVTVANVPLALSRVLERLHPDPDPRWGVSPDARIGRGAAWDGRVRIGPGAIIGSGARLGADACLEAHVMIGDGVVVGDRCWIGTGAALDAEVVLGNRVRIGAGTRLGTPGFGFAEESGTRRRMPHLGGCEIGDDVEVGANCTVDAGSVRPTIIGAGTKIDNLVHIAHNVTIGRDCVILAQVGIAGTTTVGDAVALGGQAGLAGHLTIGEGARIAAQSGVIGDVGPGETVSGYPARKHRDVLRQVATLRKLAHHLGDIEQLIDSRG